MKYIAALFVVLLVGCTDRSAPVDEPMFITDSGKVIKAVTSTMAERCNPYGQVLYLAGNTWLPKVNDQGVIERCRPAMKWKALEEDKPAAR